jgi:hypothetical protein
MSTGDGNQFIVPPPGILIEPAEAKPVVPEPLDDVDLITLPPGIVDSATYRMAQQRPPKPAGLDDAPVFFPVGAPAAPAPAADAIDDATRVSVGRRRAPAWRLTLPDGEQVLVEQTTLVGRDPAHNDQWPEALLLPIADSGKTVSKTHAVLELTASGQLVVHDLDSTNGVYATAPNGDETEVVPGIPELVEHGSELSFGQFSVTVERS